MGIIVAEQLAKFLEKVEENPNGSVRLVPAARNLLSLAENENKKLENLIEILKEWIETTKERIGSS